MKKKSFIFATLSAMTLAGVMLIVSCRKDNNVAKDHAGVAGALAVDACGCGVISADSTINAGAITTNLKLDSTKRYTLAGLVFISNNSTLTIPAGTTILGAVGSTTDPNNPGGGLIVTKGSKIIAVGTASCPIVFTSAATSPASGDWGGVILLGKAQTNQPTTTTVEGINAGVAPAGVDVTFGGTDDADNSGILKFVRIEYAGHSLSLNNEINALTLAGVGNGTTIDFVEAFKSYDDSFEWFGGSVNASHLLSIDGLDDMFDTDNGYRGTIRFALGLSDTTRADQSQSNGFESDNQANGVNTPPPSVLTHPVYRYVTIVGLPNTTKAHISNFGPGGTTGSYGRAAHLRRNAEFDIDSSIFQGFKYGLSLDTALPAPPTVPSINSYTKYFTTGVSKTFKNFVHAYDTAFIVENGAVHGVWAPKAADSDVSSTTTFYLASAWNRSAISNFIPAVGTTTRPYGAFPGGTDWTITGSTATCAKWAKLR